MISNHWFSFFYLGDASTFRQNWRPPQRNMQVSKCQLSFGHVILELSAQWAVSCASGFSLCSFAFVRQKICWKNCNQGEKQKLTFNVKNYRRLVVERNAVNISEMNCQNSKTMIVSDLKLTTWPCSSSSSEGRVMIKDSSFFSPRLLLIFLWFYRIENILVDIAGNFWGHLGSHAYNILG